MHLFASIKAQHNIVYNAVSIKINELNSWLREAAN